MGGLPTPKFTSGQTLWYADTRRVDRKHDCPDCLGQLKWSVSTPAGDAFEVPCQRCNDRWGFNDLTPLKYVELEARPQSFVVKSIEASSDKWGEGPSVTYDGRRESALFDNEPAAHVASEAMAARHNAANAVTPERIAQKHLASLTYEDARFDQFKNGLWSAWYAYNDVVGKLDDYLEGKDALSAEDTRYLREDIRWTAGYYVEKDRPLDALVKAVAGALDGDPTGLTSAFDALPEALKPMSARQANRVTG